MNKIKGDNLLISEDGSTGDTVLVARGAMRMIYPGEANSQDQSLKHGQHWFCS